jgi:tetratricopeptide (TPR) repeat protein
LANTSVMSMFGCRIWVFTHLIGVVFLISWRAAMAQPAATEKAAVKDVKKDKAKSKDAEPPTEGVPPKKSLAAPDKLMTETWTQLVAASAADRIKLAKQAVLVAAGTFAGGDVNRSRVSATRGFLQRQRTSSSEERAAILLQIGAPVPDDQGRFSTPARQTSEKAKADDDLDWLEELSRLSEQPGLSDVIADVAAVRALAASNSDDGADGLFDAAFGTSTMMYRDECGRYLRKMQARALPSLTRYSQGGGDQRRYATYQLERMDRQDPDKALSAAQGEEAVMLAVLDAFRVTHHREAVHAVWRRINHESPRVRKAARAAWLAYVTGPPPRPAPKKKLQLSGGVLAKKETPLWLTYRELAEEELRVALDEQLSEKIAPDAKFSLDEASRRIFASYDQQRQGAQRQQWSAAKANAEKGDIAGAVGALRQVLANDPDHPDRKEMATIFLKYGKFLQDNKQWQEAAVAYSTAAGLDPESGDIKLTLAAHYFALGNAQQAASKDGSAALRMAMELNPAPALPLPTSPPPPIQNQIATVPGWLLPAAGGAAAAAIITLVVGITRRRQQQRS